MGTICLSSSEIFLKRSALWVILSAYGILKYFSYFSMKTALAFHLIVYNGHNLHEMPNPVFWKNKKYIINLSSADFAQRVEKVKEDRCHFKIVLPPFWKEV